MRRRDHRRQKSIIMNKLNPYRPIGYLSVQLQGDLTSGGMGAGALDTDENVL